MAENIDWVSDESDYESDNDIATLPSESPSFLWQVIKRSAERDTLMLMYSMLTFPLLLCVAISREM